MSEGADVIKAASQLRSAVESNTVDTLTTCDFRIFINCCKKGTEIPHEILQKASKDLLVVLSSSSNCNDSQIVVATAYSSIVSYILQDPSSILQHYVHLLKQDEEQEYKIYLCYVILQLNNSYWTKQFEHQELLIHAIFEVVQSLCCELKSASIVVFKVFYNLLCKIHQIFPNGNGISIESFKTMLNIVLSNWESPLGGVRQQNSLIQGQLLLFNEELWNTVLPKAAGYNVARGTIKHQRFLELTLAHLPWTTKTKYFLLDAILQKTNILQVMASYGDDLMVGLLQSLSVPHLVSAGTDLYRTVLAALSMPEWQSYFLASFYQIMTNSAFNLENENLFSYWIHHTVKKLPDALDELLGVTTLNLYSFISLLRLKRKLGFPGSAWEELDKDKIKLALEDYSDKIRSQFFSLICTSSKTSVSPDIEEYDLIQQFLRQNINSDNTVLRQSMLNSFTYFIIRLRDTFLHLIKNNNTQAPERTQGFAFLDWLHSFLLFNLEDKCNYQRKITSLELYKIVLTYFGEPLIRKDKSYTRKSNKIHLSLRSNENPFSWSYKFESESSQKVLLNCLFDEDNDVRSSVTTILITYIKIPHLSDEDFDNFFQKGLALCSSQMFYKAESGAIITQVFVILASNSSSDRFRNIIFKGGSSFLSVLLSSAEEQFRQLQQDLLRAASQGSFLYGTLQALKLILTDPDSPEFMLLDKSQLERLLYLIEETTRFFIAVLSSKSNSSPNHAPSFGEMGMAIAAVVENSSLRDKEKLSADVTDSSSADLQLTPAEQLVLSCVWLNIKECSILCSKLVCKPLSVLDTERCVAVVVSVLRHCRHKGAIESAGVALYHITRFITSSPEARLMILPAQLMDGFLQSLVGTSATTVSRRSAGLAILVHKLITGDSRPRKPLLHTCVAKLLPIAADSEVTNGGALVDLPQSQALHFLKTLVQESSLKEHMAQYTLRVSLVALSNLASPIWTIRNAALQLIGALIPKLVGQKPHQDDGRGDHHLAFEELYFRAKPLVEVMLREFADAGKSNATNLHSKLMPMLTLVTNLSAGLQVVVAEELSKIMQMFREHFVLLFKSNIFNVRKLSAKAHSLFLTSSELVSTIDLRVQQVLSFFTDREGIIKSENELHGYLLNLTYLSERFNKEKDGMRVLMVEKGNVETMLSVLSKSVLAGQHSFFVKSLVFELSYPVNFVNDANKTFHNKLNTFVGLPHFINRQFSHLVLLLQDSEIQDKVEFWLQKSKNYDVQLSCLNALKILLRLKFEHNQLISADSLVVLVVILKDFILQNKLNTELLVLALEIMMLLLEKMTNNSTSEHTIKLSCPEFTSHYFNEISSNQTSEPVLNILLPVVSGMLSFQETTDTNLLHSVITMINARSMPSYDQDARIYAAKCMMFFIQILKSKKLEENCGEPIWKACVRLLQDEISEVRFEASRFVTTFLSGQKLKVWNPYFSLECIFKYSFVTELMTPEKGLNCLLEQTLHSTSQKDSDTGISNPFDHGLQSIYVEDSVVSHLAYCSIMELLETCRDEIKLKVKQICFSNEYKISPKMLQYVQELENSTA